MASDNLKNLKLLTEKLAEKEDQLETHKKFLEAILDISTDGYYDWHLDKDYEYLNKNFKKQIEYEDNEMENHPTDWQKIINPEDLKKMLIEVQKHFESKGEYPFETEDRYTHKQGHTVYILCRVQVIEWDDNEKPLRMVGAHIDITKLKQ